MRLGIVEAIALAAVGCVVGVVLAVIAAARAAGLERSKP